MVRVLCGVRGGGLAHFTVPPQAVSRAVAHRTAGEVWYFVSGSGRMWRRPGAQEEVVEVGPGVSVSIPGGTHFHFVRFQEVGYAQPTTEKGAEPS